NLYPTRCTVSLSSFWPELQDMVVDCPQRRVLVSGSLTLPLRSRETSRSLLCRKNFSILNSWEVRAMGSKDLTGEPPGRKNRSGEGIRNQSAGSGQLVSPVRGSLAGSNRRRCQELFCFVRSEEHTSELQSLAYL